MLQGSQENQSGIFACENNSHFLSIMEFSLIGRLFNCNDKVCGRAEIHCDTQSVKCQCEYFLDKLTIFSTFSHWFSTSSHWFSTFSHWFYYRQALTKNHILGLILGGGAWCMYITRMNIKISRAIAHGLKCRADIFKKGWTGPGPSTVRSFWAQHKKPINWNFAKGSNLDVG